MWPFGKREVTYNEIVAEFRKRYGPNEPQARWVPRKNKRTGRVMYRRLQSTEKWKALRAEMRGEATEPSAPAKVRAIEV